MPASIAVAILFVTLRLSGLLPADEYPYSRIAIQSLIVGLLLPLFLRSMFWTTSLEGSQIWFERLGALIMFVVCPLMIILAIVKAVTSN